MNPVTNKIYVANFGSSQVTVIDGATNATTTLDVVSLPWSVAVNSVTNKIYVAENRSNSITVIDGATNSITNVSAGAGPISVAVNEVTNKIYVANSDSADVTVIDGATNSTTTVGAGSHPDWVAVNPVTNQIYVGNNNSSNVTVITEQQVQAIPLTTTITPLPGNQTSTPTPAFTFNATSTFSPNPTTPANVFFQVDTWQGPWIGATGSGPTFTGTVPALQAGFHILYAYAVDGQEATSTQPGSPLIGNVTAYGFLVSPAALLSFTGNSLDDALLYDPTVGTAYTALSNGNATYQYVYNLVTPEYDVLRTGDFNGDGRSDLIL